MTFAVKPDAKQKNAAPAGPRSGAENMHLEKNASRAYANDKPDATAKAFAARRGQLLEAAACDATLTPVALRVLMLLALRWADAKTGRCWPAKATIAEALSTHEKTVQKALRELRGRGWIMVIPGAGQNGTNVYQVIHSRFEGGAKPLQTGERNHSPNLTIEPNKKNNPVHAEKVAGEASDFEDEDRTDSAQHSRPSRSAPPIAESAGGWASRGGTPTGPSTRRIATESHEWRQWQAWFSDSCIDLRTIPHCTMPDGSHGYLLPRRLPPKKAEELKPVLRWMQAKGIHPTLMAA